MIDSIEKDLVIIDEEHKQATSELNRKIKEQYKTIKEWENKLQNQKNQILIDIHDKAELVNKCNKNVDREFKLAFPELEDRMCKLTKDNDFKPNHVIEIRNNKYHDILGIDSQQTELLPNRVPISKNGLILVNSINGTKYTFEVDNYLNLYYAPKNIYFMINKLSFPLTSFFLRSNNSNSTYFKYKPHNISNNIVQILQNPDKHLIKSEAYKTDKLSEFVSNILPTNIKCVTRFQNSFRKFSFFKDEDTETSNVECKTLDNSSQTDKPKTQENSELRDVPKNFCVQPWGCRPGMKIPKSVIYEMVYDYIIKHDLLHTENKKDIYTLGEYGNALTELFNLSDLDQLSIINLHSHIEKLYQDTVTCELEETLSYDTTNCHIKADISNSCLTSPHNENTKEGNGDVYVIYHRGRCELDKPCKDANNHIFGVYDTYEKAKEDMNSIIENRKKNYIPFISMLPFNIKTTYFAKNIDKTCDEIDTYRYGTHSNELTSIYKCPFPINRSFSKPKRHSSKKIKMY